MTKSFQAETLFGFSNFGHWDLFVIWDLIFRISASLCVFSEAKPRKYWISINDVQKGGPTT